MLCIIQPTRNLIQQDIYTDFDYERKNPTKSYPLKNQKHIKPEKLAQEVFKWFEQNYNEMPPK
jgi:hypothetical protein